VDVTAFMRSTPRDLGELRKQLAELVESVKDQALRALLDAFFGDEEFAAAYGRSPAATEYHHAYVGGLLEHSVSMARSAATLAAERGAELDRDLLVAGALLHDLGKVCEMTAGPAFDYTDAGRLVGHIVLGCIEADRRMAAIADFPAQTRLHVLHLLASHHGQKEFGAPVLPATPEALALHHLDNLDAKVRAAADAEPKPGEEAWSDYQRMLGARVYKRSRTAGAEG
jgi:3'-5' exoribonuclease